MRMTITRITPAAETRPFDTALCDVEALDCTEDANADGGIVRAIGGPPEQCQLPVLSWNALPYLLSFVSKHSNEFSRDT